jgi:hypothetical protein
MAKKVKKKSFLENLTDEQRKKLTAKSKISRAKNRNKLEEDFYTLFNSSKDNINEFISNKLELAVLQYKNGKLSDTKVKKLKSIYSNLIKL